MTRTLRQSAHSGSKKKKKKKKKKKLGVFPLKKKKNKNRLIKKIIYTFRFISNYKYIF
eukprot:NODE_22124_length_722_cov_1.510924.p1 GENE.NODE_22124_length_722_cov_1.510924~~NODE_22124_length_722_cov_1.510924.p1  ORF type:complete len:58 (-),score=27.07 NODE_22124_length_722_cov_1.510924:51-224(-)